MPIDLSGPLKHLIDENIQKARRAEESGKKTDAIALYRQCASLYRQWAIETDAPDTKKQRLANAEAYENHARVLATGRPVQVQPAGAQLERGDEDEEGLQGQLGHLISQSPTTWQDIGGLDKTKREIKLAYGLSVVGMPPGVKLDSWKAMLLYGPPGTGKTMMAAATSNGLQATFFNVPLSSILSKYFGETSKLITGLYELARQKAPSVVYMDEFESLATMRTGEESGAERRVLSSILAELDGFKSKGESRYVLTIAATNVPLLLDKAVLSRFQRKVLIPLPDADARESILSILLGKRGLTCATPTKDIISRMEWFSGRDIEGLVRSAVNHMVMTTNHELIPTAEKGLDALKKYTLKVRPLSTGDWDAAFDEVKPGIDGEEYARYLTFEKKLGL